MLRPPAHLSSFQALFLTLFKAQLYVAGFFENPKQLAETGGIFLGHIENLETFRKQCSADCSKRKTLEFELVRRGGEGVLGIREP